MQIPSATYRIQFSSSFGFGAARKIVPYLASLGVSHLYASPIFKARKGSEHGYDVVDPGQINPELGTAEDFNALIRELKSNGMAWIQDVVPNHMAFDYQNQILMNVLENGQRSNYFEFFDIDWEHTYENIKGRVLAPFLGRFYGQCLEDGEISLHYGREGLAVCYYELTFPVRIDSYPVFFSHRLAFLKTKLGADHPDYIKLLGVLYVLRMMPSDGADEDYRDQVKFVKRMLWDLYSADQEFNDFVRANLQDFNGEPGRPESFALLDDLLSKQLFRLSFWKIATKEINYRRFFNINELISLRVETDEVFQRTHGLVLGLLTGGKIAGLRIDHVDGLHDPLAYLRRLRSKARDAYIVVEKILGPNEDLPDSWPVQGTTGYEFIHHVNGLFCDKKNERAFGRIWSDFIGSRVNFDDLVSEKKKVIIAEHMAGDVNNLAQLVKTISSVDRYALDATLYGLRRALAELLAAFPVYRTYIDGESSSEQDRQYIHAAVDRAVAANPGMSHELMFLKRFLLMEFPAGMDEERKADWLKVAMRFQQLTGPLMAKGFEDTALYVYNRLISLNEVGCRPDRFGCSVESFHRYNRKRRTRSPHAMNATSTHDTKRGEDVRTRIDVLSEIPEEWERQVRLWSRINRSHKKRIGAGRIPDKNDEYFLYQTLLGAFPFGDCEYREFVDRIKQYILKAVREAKVHTKWIEPDAVYEDAYMAFVESILDPSEDNQFLAEFLPFQRRIAHYGVFSSLSQALIKMTSPGVPDFYQGTELWDLNLVDPDNRRPVDFEARLSPLSEMEEKARRNLLDLLRELLSTREDGRIKLFLMSRTLQARRARPDLFSKGRYIALKTAGKYRRHIVAFAREHAGNWSLTAAPRFLTRLIGTDELPLGTEVWHDTHLILPRAAPSEWRNALTDESISVRDSLPIAQALEHFPVGFFVH